MEATDAECNQPAVTTPALGTRVPTAARRHDVLVTRDEADGALPGEEWWSRQERAGGACAMQISFLVAASGEACSVLHVILRVKKNVHCRLVINSVYLATSGVAPAPCSARARPCLDVGGFSASGGQDCDL